MKGLRRFFAGVWSILVVVLVLVSFSVLWQVKRESSETQREIKYAKEYIYLIWAMRDAALRDGLQESAKTLSELQDEAFRKYVPVALKTNLEILVREERKRATRDIVNNMRTKTGKDLGEEPGAWILEFNDGGNKDRRTKREN
jgi:hypothetical protein